MAFPTSVNSMITDSITQTNLEVLGGAPAMAMANLFMTISHALGNAAHNATYSQQQTNLTAQAATTQGISALFCLETATTGLATSTIMGAGQTPM